MRRGRIPAALGNSPSLIALVVFVVTALALLPDLGGQYVWSKDEARDGLVARDMVELKHWLIPSSGGRVYPYKPPLFHWLVALASPRGVTEWSLRLPSVLAAAATVALTYLMAARVATPTGGMVAAAVLASSTSFVEWARTGRLEMLLVLCFTLGFWSAMCWLDGGRRRHALILGLALGFGCLTKGPVGLAPLGILAIAITLLGRWSRRAVADLGLALLVAMALPVAWLAVAAGAQAGVGDYLKAVFANLAREVGVLREQHALFAGEAIGVGFLPWTFVLPGALLVLVRTWRASWSTLVLPLLWAAFVLVAFTVFISPREAYFLPIYPALAILVAWAWSTCSAQERRWMMYPLALAVVALLMAGVAVAIRPLAFASSWHLTVIGRAVGIAAAFIACAIALGWVALVRHRRVDAVPIVVGSGALLVVLLLHVAVHTPRANRAHPTRDVAARFDAALPPGAEVAYVDLKFTTALMFYLQHRPLELLRVRAITELAHRPQRYALIPREEFAWLIRKNCAPPPPLREETLLGGGYVLFDLDGVASRCPWAPRT